jgi:iron complex transport system ATP-binding protein
LEDVSLQVHAGEFVAVIGPNGAGKSTLLAALAGLIRPDDGSVMLDAHPLRQVPPAQLARRRAYLPQNPRLEWPLPVERLVALGLTPHLPAVGPLPEHFQPAIETALEACDLVTQRDQPATTLSGGEFARAMLARALVGEPQLAMMKLLSRQAMQGKLVIASLHDLTLAARHATRIIALVDGRLISDTKALTEELIHKVFGVACLMTGKGDSVALTLLSPSEK